MHTVDVLVVGGGPTGLIMSYSLLRAGLRVLAVEKCGKEQETYGRACMLYCRSVEILDQLGLFESIAEIGYIVRGNVTYRGHKEFPNRGWSFASQAAEGKTYVDYSLSIRQKMLQEAFRDVICGMNPDALRTRAKLLTFAVNLSEEYPVLAKVEIDGTATLIRSKYLVGADGGHSTVRPLARISFPGIASPFRWVRLDAVVHTDMPAARIGAVSVESSSHGNILWTPTDNGRTRIGFLCPPTLHGENGKDITAPTIMAEAQVALKPFSVKFVQLDWWTVYNVGQRVAECFRAGPVFLAGDAAHTHSSGAAQGMNTGIHDASNLAWKLAGVLRGWFTDAVLDTYATERRESVQHMIQLDKDIASLISGVIPAHFDSPPDADAHMLLDDVYQSSAAFTIGLGIDYPANIINQSRSNNADDRDSAAKGVQVGHRAPDVLLHRPGSPFPARLQQLTPNTGRFWLLVFAGGLDPTSAQPRLRPASIDKFSSLCAYIKSPASFVRMLQPAFEFLTVIRGERILQTAETLGGQKSLGRAVHDRTGDAYMQYGVDEAAGALVVLRPDGIVGFIADMDSFHAVGEYFTEFVRPKDERMVISNTGEPFEANVAQGEMSLEGSHGDDGAC